MRETHETTLDAAPSKIRWESRRLAAWLGLILTSVAACDDANHATTPAPTGAPTAGPATPSVTAGTSASPAPVANAGQSGRAGGSAPAAIAGRSGVGGGAAVSPSSRAGSAGRGDLITEPTPDVSSVVDPADLVFEPAKFAEPPPDYAPGIQWLWPGGSVDDATIATQVALLAKAGYRAIAIQTSCMGMDPAEIDADPNYRTVGLPAYFDRVRAVARATRENGMEFDLTLGSGWPNGGPGVPPELQEQQMLWQRLDVMGPIALDLPLPAAAEPLDQFKLDYAGRPIIGAFDAMAELEAVVAAPIVNALANPPVLGPAIDISERAANGRIQWDVPDGAYAILALYRNTTSHNVIGSAFPGDPNESRVLNHLGPAGARWLIDNQINPWLDTLGDDKPKNLFIDSFEMAGQLPWSAELATRYSARVGRAPYADMPFFFRAGSETKYVEIARASSPPTFAHSDAELGLRLREEYERVRADAFHEDFITPVAEAIRSRGLGLRLQAHGGWGVVLDDYARADVPESEGIYGGGGFDFVTLAGSAAHVAGRRTVSTETFTTLNVVTTPDVFNETDLWKLVGLAFTAGITRPIHSWYTYPYTKTDGTLWNSNDPDPAFPGGYTLDIQPNDDHWAFLPSFNRAQARVGYAVSRGQPQMDLAWLKTDREFRDQALLAIGNIGTYAPESAGSAALRAASYTYDRVSPRALQAGSAEQGVLAIGASRYRALLVDNARVIDPEVLEAIAAAVTAKVPIVWVGAKPARALGIAEADSRDARVAALWSELSGQIKIVTDPAAVPAALRELAVLPAIEAPGTLGTIGMLHRSLENGHLVWLFNESDSAQDFTATLHIPASSAQWLDPQTGTATDAMLQSGGAGGASVSLSLEPWRGGVLFLQP